MAGTTPVRLVGAELVAVMVVPSPVLAKGTRKSAARQHPLRNEKTPEVCSGVFAVRIGDPPRASA